MRWVCAIVENALLTAAFKDLVDTTNFFLWCEWLKILPVLPGEIQVSVIHWYIPRELFSCMAITYNSKKIKTTQYSLNSSLRKMFRVVCRNYNFFHELKKFFGIIWTCSIHCKSCLPQLLICRLHAFLWDWSKCLMHIFNLLFRKQIYIAGTSKQLWKVRFFKGMGKNC